MLSVYTDGMSALVVPLPLVSQRTLVASYDPLFAGSAKGRFQTLRSGHVVSNGIRRPVRAVDGRVRGSLHLYSVLNRGAVCLYRQGHMDAARTVAEQAGNLERSEDAQAIAVALASIAGPQPFEADFAWPAMEQLMGDERLSVMLIVSPKHPRSSASYIERGSRRLNRLPGWCDLFRRRWPSSRRCVETSCFLLPTSTKPTSLAWELL